MQRVTLPPYEEGCDADAAKVDCDYPPYKLNKLISTEFADSGSPAVDLIRNFEWTNEDQNTVSTYIAQDGMDPDEAARSGSTTTRTRSTPGSRASADLTATSAGGGDARPRPTSRKGQGHDRHQGDRRREGVRDDSGLPLDRIVFGIAAALSVAFVLVGWFWPDELADKTTTVLTWITENFGWLFVLTSAGFVLFSAYLAFTRYGNIKLGPDDSEPEFSTFSWVSMMFATGMGIGLMFWGVAEPLTHFNAPPMGLAEPGTPEAAQLAMEYSFFHWGFHPWSMYAVIGLSIGYFAYRKGYGNLVSATFRPLLGDRASQGPGKAIDVVAIFATLFGSATSLGLGALQITGGIDNVFGSGAGSKSLAGGRDRGADALLRALGGVRRREGHQVPLQRQCHRCGPARAVPVRGRPDGLHPRGPSRRRWATT